MKNILLLGLGLSIVTSGKSQSRKSLIIGTWKLPTIQTLGHTIERHSQLSFNKDGTIIQIVSGDTTNGVYKFINSEQQIETELHVKGRRPLKYIMEVRKLSPDSLSLQNAGETGWPLIYVKEKK